MSAGLPKSTQLARPNAEGLRARKKRELRQRLSDTATQLFLEHGFAGVRVIDIAAACSVSEATVFNYFPTKESLILDRLDTTATAIIEAVRDDATDPVPAVTNALTHQVRLLLASARDRHDDTTAIAGIHRFGELLRSTPPLRAHFNDRKDTYTRAAAAKLGQRYDLDANDPRMTIAATTLIGLWQVQSDSLFHTTGKLKTLASVARRVDADLQSAAELIELRLNTLQ
jgi:AcrR family transcriptional regulator